jgi:hypothetical protein
VAKSPTPVRMLSPKQNAFTSSENAMKIPIKITLDYVESVEDLRFHELVVVVPGADASMTIALMESNEEGDVDVSHVKRDGLDVLDEGSRDQLLIRLFKLAYGQMIEDEGSGIEWWISNLSRFLQQQFTAAEAAGYSFALGKLVTDVEVKDMVVVRID